MILKTQKKVLCNWTKIIYVVISKSLPTCRFNWLDPAKLEIYFDGSLRDCVLEANLEYPTE